MTTPNNERRVEIARVETEAWRPLQSWIKEAMRFIDLCDADAVDYADNGLHDHAESLMERGFAFFGAGESDSLATIERMDLETVPPVTRIEAIEALREAVGDLQNLYFNVAGPRTFAAIDKLEALKRALLSGSTPKPAGVAITEEPKALAWLVTVGDDSFATSSRDEAEACRNRGATVYALAPLASASSPVAWLTYHEGQITAWLADKSRRFMGPDNRYGRAHSALTAALSAPGDRGALVEITGDDAIRAAITELDERVYRRTMQQVNATAVFGDGSARDRKAYVARTERMNDLLDGLKACLSPAALTPSDGAAS